MPSNEHVIIVVDYCIVRTTAFRIACTKVPVEHYSGVLDLKWIPHGYIGPSRDDCVTAHDKDQVGNGHIPPVGEKCIGTAIQLIVTCAVFDWR
jgi:hypothetical protein